VTRELALADVAEPFFRDPKVVRTADGDYDDHPASLFAFTAHGFDTGMEPFYSADQLKDAMRAAWDAASADGVREGGKP
jgi:hypothetical protein